MHFPDATHLQIATNAIAFSGIMFDVVAAFLALLSSARVQASTDCIDRLHYTISASNSKDLQEISDLLLDRLVNQHHSTHKNAAIYIEFDLWEEIGRQLLRLEERHNGGHNQKSQRQEIMQNSMMITPDNFIREVERAGKEIIGFSILGNLAGTATLLGILCFLLSVVCLAKSTQPSSVWIPTVISCSSILVFPMLAAFLYRSDLRASVFYSFFPKCILLMIISTGVLTIF